MSKTTSMNLGSHFEGFINKLTQTGRYGSASEAMRAGLRLLEHEEAKIEALQQALIAGEDSGESDRTLDDIFAEVKTEFHAQ